MTEPEETEWARVRLERWSNRQDSEALGELLKWQRDRAFATALRILGQASDADDAVQQAFLKMLTRTHGFASADAFRVAVYRAVTQCSLDLIRANRVRVRLEKAIVGLESANRSQTMAEPEQAENLNLVWREMEALSEEQRALVVLCCQEGLSVSDAAEILSVPRETLRDRLKAALEALRARLANRGLIASAVMLALLLKQGAAQAASPVLCEALDATLPGRACAEIPTQRVSEQAFSFELPEPTRVPVRTPWALTAAGVAALLLMGVGVAWVYGGARTPQTTDSRPYTVLAAPAEPQPAKPLTTPAVAEPPTPVAPQQAALNLERRAARKNPDAIALEKVPEAVLAACARSVPGIQLIEAEFTTEKGKPIYELKGRAAAGVMEVKITPEGQVLEVELDDDDDDDDAENAVAPKAKPKPELPAGDF